MTSLISITPAPKSEPETINSQLCRFLSGNTVGAYDIRLHGMLSNTPGSAPINAIEALTSRYSDVQVDKLLSVSAIDTSFAESAQLALFLANINDRPIELAINRVPVVIEPGQTLDDVRDNFLKSFLLRKLEIDGTSTTSIDTMQQQFDGEFNFEDCVRNAMVVSRLLGETVQFTFYSMTPSETVKGFVAPSDDYISIVQAHDPRLRAF